MAGAEAWPNKIKSKPLSKSKVEKSLKTYTEVVRREKPPAERARFTPSESDKLRTIS